MAKRGDFTQYGNIALRSLQDLSENAGKGKVVRFIRGSKAKDIYERLRSLPTYGLGKDQKETFWSELLTRLLAEGYTREKLKTGHMGMTYNVLALHTKGQQWLQNYERDKSTKMELEMTEFLKLPGGVEAKSSDQTVSHLVDLPSIPCHDEALIKRFMLGPWKGDGTQASSVNSDEIRRLERQLYQKLRGLRTRIAEENSSKINI